MENIHILLSRGGEGEGEDASVRFGTRTFFNTQTRKKTQLSCL